MTNNDVHVVPQMDADFSRKSLGNSNTYSGCRMVRWHIAESQYATPCMNFVQIRMVAPNHQIE